MLAHVSSDHGITIFIPIDDIEHHLGCHFVTGGFCIDLCDPYFFFPEALDGCSPLGMFLAGTLFQQSGQAGCQVTHKANIDYHIFVDLCKVSVQLDNFGISGILADIACCPVTEADTDTDDQVCIFLCHGRGIAAVHALHSQVAVIGIGNCGNTHERRANIGIQGFCQGHYILTQPGTGGTTTNVDIGALGGTDELDCFFHGPFIHFFLRERLNHGLLCKGAGSHLDVFGNIDEDRTGTVGFGDLEGFPDGVSQLINIGDEVIVLGDGHRHTGDIDLLEAVSANQAGGNISGDGDHGDRVQHGSCNAGYQVGGTGAGGSDHNTDFAGSTGIAVGCVGSTLLMGSDNMVQSVAGLIKGIINIQNLSTGITENIGNTLLNQCFDHNL